MEVLIGIAVMVFGFLGKLYYDNKTARVKAENRLRTLRRQKEIQKGWKTIKDIDQARGRAREFLKAYDKYRNNNGDGNDSGPGPSTTH